MLTITVEHKLRYPTKVVQSLPTKRLDNEQGYGFTACVAVTSATSFVFLWGRIGNMGILGGAIDSKMQICLSKYPKSCSALQSQYTYNGLNANANVENEITY